MKRFTLLGALVALLVAPAAQARTFYEARLEATLYYSTIQNEDARELGSLDGVLLASNDGKFGTLMFEGVEYAATIGEFSINDDRKVRVSLNLPRAQMKALLERLAKLEGKSAFRERALSLVTRYFEPVKGVVKDESFLVAECHGYCSYFNDNTMYQFHDDLSAESLHVRFDIATKGKIRGEPSRRGD